MWRSDLYIFEVSCRYVAAGFNPAEMGGFPQVSRSNMSASSRISPAPLRLPAPIRSVRKSAGVAAVLLF